jgi:hypothetical protein
MQYGCLLLKLHHSVVGLPDRILLGPGAFVVLIELKRRGKTPSKIQGYFLDTLTSMGFDARKIDTLAEFRLLLTASTDSGKLRSVPRGAAQRRTR